MRRGARARVKRAIGAVVRTLAARRADLPLSTWRLSRDEKGALVLAGRPLQTLVDRWGSPLFVVDAARLVSNARRFMSSVGEGERCEVFCSYKTNPVPAVLRILHRAGVGAEVASPYELWLALKLGVSPGSIVYNGPAKTSESLRVAIARDVGLVNVNARSEIDDVVGAARAVGKRATVGIRIVPRGYVGGQFGEPVEGGAALAAFREALQHPELRVVALHAHHNGEIASEAALDAFLSGVLDFVDVLRDRLGLQLEILDVGGNLASPTVSQLGALEQRLCKTFGAQPSPRRDAVVSIEAYVERVVRAVSARCTRREGKLPRIFVEPGRALMGDAQMLLTRVLTARAADAEGMRWATIDAGIQIAEAVRNEFHQLYPLRDEGAARLPYRLTGPSCTLGDLLYPAWSLPELHPGDALAIMDAGAYFVPFSTCFSFPRAGVVVVHEDRCELARARETFEDLVDLDVFDEEAPSREAPMAQKVAVLR